jgi:hypothetical protein
MKKKLIIYVIGILVSLFLPFILAMLFIGNLPDEFIIAQRFLNEEKNKINMEALKGIQGTTHVERINVAGHKDHILMIRGKDLIRFVLPESKGLMTAVIDKSDADAKTIKSKKGIKATGTNAFKMGGFQYKISKFSDGSASYTQGFSGTVLQVITKDDKNLKEYFKNIGIVMPNDQLQKNRGWLSKNRVLIFIILVLIYCLFWVMGIFKGGAWVAAVDPDEGVKSIPKEELKTILMKINELDVPFEVIEKDSDTYSVEWKMDKKWQGILESRQVKILYHLGMKLNDRRKSVSVIESKRNVVLEKGILRLKAGFELFRGITFKSYEKEAVYGLSYTDGRLAVTGYNYTFNVQEIKNPLIELVTGSGWKWEPHVLKL